MRITTRPFWVFCFLLVLLVSSNVHSQTGNNNKQTHSITFNVTNKQTGEALTGVICNIENLGLYGVTDNKGKVTLFKIPEGLTKVKISYLGYESRSMDVTVSKDLDLDVKLVETSLALDEVTVTATRSSNKASSSVTIGRQAIDHLQASTLGDIMELVPGFKIQGKVDRTTGEKLTLRTVDSKSNNRENNSLGTAIIVDGIALSNNANPGKNIGSINTTGSGIDTRQISTDDIESVEVITGVPSAEYGDLSSGAVIIKTKYGMTPWNARLKINPNMYNASGSKGFRSGKTGVINTSFDYMQAYDDPRRKTRSVDRYTGAIAYTNTFLNNLLYTNTKISYSGIIDWDKKDPDQVQDGTSMKVSRSTINFVHNGNLSFNKLFSRTLSYNIGYSYGINDARSTRTVAVSGGKPIITSMTSGYFDVPYLTKDYMATGYSESRPATLTARISNTFHLNPSEKILQRFNMGLEYNNSSNSGKGYYDENPLFPYDFSENGRPRPFYDIPAINTYAAYLEDNITFKITRKKELNLQAGVRYTGIQLGKEEQVQSLSPRLNARMDITKNIAIRGAYGLNSKTPSMSYLYPEKNYKDRKAAIYLPQDAPGEWIYYVHTQVYDVQRSDIKNMTNQRYELGMDVKLGSGRSINVTAYHDKVKDGFSSQNDYTTYLSNYYTLDHGIVVNPGSKPTIDWNNPERVDTVWMSKGTFGNNAVSINRGIEFSMNLGYFKSINTSFQISGAYRETQNWTKGTETSTPVGLPITKAESDVSIFKFILPHRNDKQVFRNFISTFKAICNIPQLRMVATLTYQNVFYNYSWKQGEHIMPIAWQNNDLSVHPITSEMLNDPDYKIKGVLLKDVLPKKPKENKATIIKPIGFVNFRLSMDVTKSMGVAFYTNNMFFYQPWQSTNQSKTLVLKNDATFAFGVEAIMKF